MTDKMIDTALWWDNMRKTNNDAFLPLLFDEHRYLVLKGGGGSGKSIFAGRKVLERCVTEPGHRILVCRKVARTLRESCFDQLRNQIADFYPTDGAKVNKTDMTITFNNGSKILFAGLDDVEKLKSIYNITGIWIEEASELEESDFNQLDIRLRGETDYYKQIILSFNPVSITHWLKKRFFDTEDERAYCHESTYKDNRFLDDEAIRTLESFRDTDEYYYMVYCLGQWGVTGRTVFNAKAVSARLEAIANIEKRSGTFSYKQASDGIHITTWEFTEGYGDAVTIYKEPEPGVPYVIGGDTAGDGSDWFVAQVLNNITGEQVATLRHQYDEDTYARQIYCLGRYYNSALIAIEVNFSTYPVKLLDMMGYKELYVRDVEDQFDGRIRHAFGFRTDTLTRPVIISELIRVMREHIGTVNNEETLMEMLTFIRNEKTLKPEAEEGAHDDCIMALAIAHYIRPQQRMTREAKSYEVDTTTWTRDMWDDYNRATPEEREYLISVWGNPER